MKKAQVKTFNWRRYFALSLILLVFVVIFMRAVQLQLLDAEFYEQKGIKTQVGVAEIPAHRGVIKDRHGEALAISTPVYSISANPRVILQNPESILSVARILQMDPAQLRSKIESRAEKYFVYLKRHVPPTVHEAIIDSKLAGVFSQEEYRRYYPARDMLAHVIGLTNIETNNTVSYTHLTLPTT